MYHTTNKYDIIDIFINLIYEDIYDVLTKPLNEFYNHLVNA